MRYLCFAACAAALSAGAAPRACAHVIAGARVFPVTLTFDDPGVSDEFSLPALGYTRGGADGGRGPSHEVDLGGEFDKRITPHTALIFNDGYDIQQMNGAKLHTGWENLVITGKWQAYTNGPHETVVSLGLQRALGGTGTLHTGADQYGSTTPTLYIGKGMGDLPVDGLRPFALTGELGYTIADKGLKLAPITDPQSGLVSLQLNHGNPDAWAGGVSVQYSIPYLQSQVRDIGLHGVLGDMIPVMEFTYTSPASPISGQDVTWTAAPGLIYLRRWGEIAVEATVPLNRATGSNIGVVALLHVFVDDLLPRGIGAPLFQ